MTKEEIRANRIARGWTQQALAEKLGHSSRSQVCMWEKDGQRMPSAENQQNLKEVFEANPIK